MRTLARVAVMWLLAVPVRAEVIDRVLAVVAGDVIMLSDLAAARDLGLVSAGDAPDPMRAVLLRLIDRSLMLAEVERYAPPEPPADAVDRELAAVRARFAAPEAFDRALARAGIDANHLRGTLRQDLRLRAYLAQRFTVAPPTDEELERYYREHPGQFTRNRIVRPFDEVRAEALRHASDQRRQQLVDEWLAGLRRRAEILDLYVAP